MASSFDYQDDRQHGHAIRRRKGGRTSIYHNVFYPVSMAIGGGALAVPCGGFVPDVYDASQCAACGESLDDHGMGALGSFAPGGIPGSDGATGAV
jgi:hypothetical protein